MSGARLETRAEAQVAMNNSKKLASPSIRSWLVAVLAAALTAAGCAQDDLTVPTENPDDMVDPALVGRWQVTVPGGGYWALKIESYGHYEFSNASASPAPSHQGRLAARGGRWLLQSVTGIEDSGTYEVFDDGIELKGNVGAVRWLRAGAMTGVTPGANAAPLQPPALGGTSLPSIAAAEPPVTIQTEPAVTPEIVAARAAAARSAEIPDIVDPCLLVTAEEAAFVFGEGATTQRTTPQPRTQNDCLYRGASGQSFQITSYNGRGLDAARYIDNKLGSGGVKVDGIGAAAVQSYRQATGLSSLDFVIGGTSVTLLVGGVPGDRAQPALVGLALQAAQRLTSSTSAYDMGGLDRFVGTWRVENYPPNGGKRSNGGIVIVQSNGDLEVQTSVTLSGTLEIDGDAWRFESPLYSSPPRGSYRLRGNELTITGETARAQLKRVQCGTEPQTVRPPYELARTLEGSMRSTTRLAPNVRPPESKTLDEQLVGLWEGQGTFADIPTTVLFSVDSRGFAVLALYPRARGRLEADNGQYTFHLQGAPAARGSYSFEGGIRDGLIRLQNSDGSTDVWYPTDTSQHPVFETPLVAHCQ